MCGFLTAHTVRKIRQIPLIWYKFVGWVKFADPADYNVYVALPSEKDINFGWKQYESLRKHSE